MLMFNMAVLSLIFLMYLLIMKTSIIMEVYISSYNMMSVSLMIDLISMTFMTTVFFISTLVMLYSVGYMKGENENKFSIMMILFISFMVILCLSGNLLWVMIGWDGLGVSSFVLIMFFQNWKSFNSAMVTFMCNRVGDLFILSSISWLLSINTLNSWINNLPWLIQVMFMITALSKSAQIPFSSWLPLAMAAPTPVSSLVHSSTLVTAGVFLMIRLNSMMENEVLMILMVISSSTVILAGISALWEFDFKKIIALSTLSHIGLMMMFISINDYWSSMAHLITHSMFKSVLFMCAGVTIHSMNNIQDIRMINSINKSSNGVMVISILSMMGLPFMTGFYSKELMIMSLYSFNMSMYFSTSFLLAVSLTCIYSIRLLLYIMWGKFQHYYMMTEENKDMMYPLLAGCILSCSVGGIIMWDMLIVDELPTELYLNSMMKDTLILFMVMGIYYGNKSLMIDLGKLTLPVSSMLFISSFCYVMQNFLFKKSFLFMNLDIKGWSNYIMNNSLYMVTNSLKLYIKKLFNQPININNMMVKTWMMVLMINILFIMW